MGLTEGELDGYSVELMLDGAKDGTCDGEDVIKYSYVGIGVGLNDGGNVDPTFLDEGSVVGYDDGK